MVTQIGSECGDVRILVRNALAGVYMLVAVQLTALLT
jgi:hypothetical protein